MSIGELLFQCDIESRKIFRKFEENNRIKMVKKFQ